MGLLDRINRAIFSKPPEHAKQTRRNDPCWCGSGKKYKRCHYDSDRKYYASRGNSRPPSS